MTRRRRLDRWWDLITLAGSLAVALIGAVLLITIILAALAGPK